MAVRIFISYSQEDFKPDARFLCNYLSKHIPDSDVFIDQLKPKGTKWQEENDRRLKESNIVVIILTNSALAIAMRISFCTANFWASSSLGHHIFV